MRLVLYFWEGFFLSILAGNVCMHADAMEKFSILEGSQKAMSKSTTSN